MTFIFLTETKINCLDDITIPDYEIIVSNRKGARKSSGRVAILVHKIIEKCIKRLDNNINETFGSNFQVPQTVNLLPGYIWSRENSPSDSPYADPTVFYLIENTIVELTSENENTQVCLLGDFIANA